MSVPDRSDKKAFAEYAAGVMKGHADGRGVEGAMVDYPESFVPITDPLWNWERITYRLVPEAPAVEPWTFETVPVGVVIERKDERGRFLIVGAVQSGAYLGSPSTEDSSPHSWSSLLDCWRQLDGSPCGTLKAGEWPRWFTVAKDENSVWKMTDEREGEYHHKGKYYNESAFSVAELLADKTIKQITAAEAEALIQKARAK